MYRSNQVQRGRVDGAGKGIHGRTGRRGGQKTVSQTIRHQDQGGISVEANRPGVARYSLAEERPGREAKVEIGGRKGAGVGVNLGYDHGSPARLRRDIELVGKTPHGSESGAGRARGRMTIGEALIQIRDSRTAVQRENFDPRVAAKGEW